MNLRSFSFILISAFIGSQAVAQSNLLNAKTPAEINKKTEAQIAYDNDGPLPYGYVDKRDVLWSKNVWEKIDLDERMNFPLYYPVDSNIGDDRRSLYDVLIDNIQNGRIQNIYADSYFTSPRTLKEVEGSLVRVDTTDIGRQQYNAGEEISPEFIDRREISAADVEEYRVRGYWYIDKRQGELKYRLLGIAPVTRDVNFIDDDNAAFVELFWVFFPEVREILHEAQTFNSRNSSQPISYDHLLNSRKFSAIIYKEDNVYGDREIKDYISDNSLMQLLEAERIKESIRNVEMDMWSN